MISKEEIPISTRGGFIMPIHPHFLDSERQFDSEVGYKVFSRVADEWYSDLSEYACQLDNLETKKWIEEVWLSQQLRVKWQGNTPFFNGWEAMINTLPSGAPGLLSISRNAGGTLYIEKPPQTLPILTNSRLCSLTEANAQEYRYSDSFQSASPRMAVYSHHNVDNYPGALFLRNWAIAIDNELLQ